MTKRGFIVGAPVILALFVALRWNNWNAPLVRDEGEYAYAAQLLRHGQLPYEHSFLQKPPMVVYAYALADLIAPHQFQGPRVLAMLFVAGATVLLGAAAWIELGSAVALSAMLLFTGMVLLPGIQQFTANVEQFMLLPLMAAVALCASAGRREVTAAHWIFFGVLAAISFLFKYTCLPILAALLCWLIIRQCRGPGAARIAPARLALAVLSFVITAAVILAPFLLRDGGRRFWECTVLFNHHYAASSTFGLTGLWFGIWLLWASWWPLFVFPLVLAWFRPPRISFWLWLFLASWLATAGSLYGHYYVLITPFWALLLAVGVQQCAEWTARRHARFGSWAAPCLAAALLIVVCLPHWRWLRLSGAEFASRISSDGGPFVESMLVAQRVADLSTPQDPVFVAGSEPQILYYAQRFSPSRFVIAYPMTIPSPLAKAYQLEAISELKTRPPKVIVMSLTKYSWIIQRGSPPDLLNYLDDIISRRYKRVGGYLPGAGQGIWMEPLPESLLSKSSLVVYTRDDGPDPELSR